MTHTQRSKPSEVEPENNSNRWLNTDELAEVEVFESYLQENFPKQATIMRQYGMDRRTFLKVMGASLTMAGFGLQGCTTPEAPNEAIIPYVRMPEEIIPGIPLLFTSTMTLGGYATGVLIETHEGRPHRVEGNTNHPASLGGADAILISSILELYNPDRSIDIRDQQGTRSWDEYMTALETALENASGSGTGLRLLTENITSPTLINQIEGILEEYPDAEWVQYEPVSRDSIIAGAQMAFGEPVDTVYHFDEASVVLSLDSDFLTNQPGNLRYARDMAARLQIRSDSADSASAEMSRIYAVESTPTITGASADHRLKVRASEVEGFTRALGAALGLDVEAPQGNWDQTWFDALVEDLEGAGSNALVVAGPEQPAIVHALAHAINDALGAVGTTLDYIDPVAPNTDPQVEGLRTLTADMAAGRVGSLFIIGGNPVYDAPADIDFAGALATVPFSTHLSLYDDETSALTRWHVPMAHYIEAWGDARAYDGTASLVQPPIGPLLDTFRSATELLAAITGDDRRAYDILREYWEGEYEGDDFDSYWRTSLHDGVLADTAFEPVSVSLDSGFLSETATNAVSADQFEVIFQPDPFIYDGRFANNPWLQEVPKPMSKITWDNTALISPATAMRLGVSNEDVLDITVNGRTMQAPVWIMPLHPDNAVTVSLGYGHGIGADVGSGFDFNAYTVRTSDAPWFTAGEVSASGQTYELAPTQTTLEVELVEAIRTTTLGGFNENPAYVYEDHDAPPFPSLLPDDVFIEQEGPDYSDGYKWGMTIDQTACIGCNACMIACQSENNINTVGKEQVKVGREMHWIRVDRYDDSHTGRAAFQPVPCMHCEKAPCEQVCPVQATVHSHEGLNQMVYNRCVGTRYCSANCPYGVRRFNFLNYVSEDPIQAELYNPDVSVRERGIMEKCSYCVQRINEAHAVSGVEDRPIQDGEVVPACASACPTRAIVFGDLNNPDARVTQIANQPHNYGLLEDHNTQPRTTYLGKVYNPNETLAVNAEATTEEEA